MKATAIGEFYIALTTTISFCFNFLKPNFKLAASSTSKPSDLTNSGK